MYGAMCLQPTNGDPKIASVRLQHQQPPKNVLLAVHSFAPCQARNVLDLLEATLKLNADAAVPTLVQRLVFQAPLLFGMGWVQDVIFPVLFFRLLQNLPPAGECPGRSLVGS